VTAEASVGTGSQTQVNTTTTALSVTELNPLVARFGGQDNQIGNLDVLAAVNAANSGGQIGGQTVSNLDVLGVVNYVNNQ
jgi:hypothetical protein